MPERATKPRTELTELLLIHADHLLDTLFILDDRVVEFNAETR